MSRQRELRIAHLNVDGWREESADRVLGQANTVDCACDIIVLTETWFDGVAAGDFAVPGYTAHHCVREQHWQGRGRPNGGVTVLLRDASLLGEVVVRAESLTGIVWVEMTRLGLVLAACYFSPDDSKVYQRRALHPDPLEQLFSGIAARQERGLHVVVVGDLNARVGRRQDTPELPLGRGVEEEAAQRLYAAVPSRTSVDDGPLNSRGRRLLELLPTAQLVLLNGRAEGDTQGALTFVRNVGPSSDACSVVDLAFVSVALYPSVQRFAVLGEMATVSPHRMIWLRLVLPPQPASGVRPIPAAAPPAGTPSRCPVLRPLPQDYPRMSELLQQHEQQLATALQRLEAGQTDATVVLSEITGVLRAAGRQAIRERRNMPGARQRRRGPVQQPGANAPWWDDECAVTRNNFEQQWRTYRQLQQSLQPDSPELIAVHSRASDARRCWDRMKKAKKAQWAEEQEHANISAYFSAQQRDFWRAFAGPPLRCPLDLAAWRQHCERLLGAGAEAAPPQPPPPGHDPQSTLDEFDRTYRRTDFPDISTDVSADDVLQIVRALQCGKAADAEGLTAECLKAAAHSNAVPSLFRCLAYVLSHVHMHCPSQFARNKLTPVPKTNDAGTDVNKYRGIAVASLYGKLYDRIMNGRASAACEGLGLREPVQCGFRPEHGTLDALFTVRHLIDNARHCGRMLYSCFIDFEKAFDRVDRGKLLDACRRLGMHGTFLAGIQRIYEDIQMVVAINGTTGEPFATHKGTKQGSELSPLLFGIFIEQLHKLIALKAPGAGPLVGAMRVPDILYADDVAMLARTAEELQDLLDVLALFCTLFDMRVNLAKTRIVVFRGERTRRPLHDWLLNGQPVKMADRVEYLGVWLHETRPLDTDSFLADRARKGQKALFAMLAKCRRLCIYQSAFKCRLFDVLVEPALSYGCHIWGADVCRRMLDSPSALSLEKVHLVFLRMMAGVGDKVHHASLLKEFDRYPIMVHWIKLLARFWNRMSALARDPSAAQRLLPNAFLADVELMLSGCQNCWVAKTLTVLTTLGLTSQAQWGPSYNRTAQQVIAIEFDEDEAEAAARRHFDRVWRHLPADPRTAPSNQVVPCTYLRWVGIREGGPPHLKIRIPFLLKQQLIRLRLGWHALAVQTGRMRRRQQEHIPRDERTCKACGRVDVPEDMFHFLCECSMYNAIRQRYSSIFGGSNPVHALVHAGPRLRRDDLMQHILNHPHQLTLARALTDMYEERRRLLSAPNAVLDTDSDGEVGVEYNTALPALHELGAPHIRPGVEEMLARGGAAQAVSELRRLAVTTT